MMSANYSVPGPEDTRVRDLLLAVSISNLLLLDVWRKLVFADQFLLPVWSWRDLAAAFINIGIFAAIVFGFIRLTRIPRLASYRLHQWMCLLPAAVILNYLRRRQLETARAHWGDLRVWLALAAALLVTLFLLLHWRRRLLAAAEITVLCMAAFLPMAVLQAAWAIAHQPPLPMLASPLPAAPSQPRVVWIIFDEMDWRYVDSSRRPPKLELPELDRLRSESFYAENTTQAGVKTLLAMPSLITGTQFIGGHDQGKDHLVLKAALGGVSSDLRTAPNIFREARQRGINAGVVGWYMPYCRLMPDALTRCYWESLDTEVHSSDPDLRVSLWSQLLTVSPFEKRQRHERRFEQMLGHAKELASDRSLGLVLLHMPVPHGPAIYDRRNGELTAFTVRPDWYLDNLALADRALGEIRRAMERAGVWDSSTVLVSSDHSLRWYSMMNESTDPRIPFLLKLPGQQHGVTYPAHLSAILSHDLMLALLDNEVMQPGQLVPWAERHEQAYVARLHQAAEHAAAMKNAPVTPSAAVH